MSEIIVIIHLLVVLSLIGLILIQRSEGGGLGMGSGVSGFMTSRGKANVLTRTTAILAAIFFATSMVLAILAAPNRASRSLIDAPVQPGQGGILDQLPKAPASPQAPVSK